jgi:hypothetical protein
VPPRNSIVSLTCPFRLRGRRGTGWLADRRLEPAVPCTAPSAHDQFVICPQSLRHGAPRHMMRQGGTTSKRPAGRGNRRPGAVVGQVQGSNLRRLSRRFFTDRSSPPTGMPPELLLHYSALRETTICPPNVRAPSRPRQRATSLASIYESPAESRRVPFCCRTLLTFGVGQREDVDADLRACPRRSLGNPRSDGGWRRRPGSIGRPPSALAPDPPQGRRVTAARPPPYSGTE